MKNHLIYFIGIIILIITVWFTTMAGIKANKEKEENKSFVYVEFFSFENEKINEKLDKNSKKMVIFA